MERMNALETYPSHHHFKSNDNDDKYSHVARKFDRNTKCGTLSKSEWEAISKFEKMFLSRHQFPQPAKLFVFQVCIWYSPSGK